MQSPALHFLHLPWPLPSLANSPGPPRLLYFREAFQFGKANTAEEKGNTLQNSTRPPKEIFFLVFSLTFSTGLKPRMCPVFFSLVPPHRPPHPWCLRFPEC